MKKSNTIHLAGLLTLLFVFVPVAVSAGSVQHLDQEAWEALHGEAIDTSSLRGDGVPFDYSNIAPEDLKPKEKPVPITVPYELTIMKAVVFGGGGF